METSTGQMVDIGVADDAYRHMQAELRQLREASEKRDKRLSALEREVQALRNPGGQDTRQRDGRTDGFGTRGRGNARGRGAPRGGGDGTHDASATVPTSRGF
jgi:hypothetical protein